MWNITQRSRDRDNLTQLVGWVSVARAFVVWSAPGPRVTIIARIMVGYAWIGRFDFAAIPRPR